MACPPIVHQRLSTRPHATERRGQALRGFTGKSGLDNTRQYTLDDDQRNPPFRTTTEKGPVFRAFFSVGYRVANEPLTRVPEAVAHLKAMRGKRIAYVVAAVAATSFRLAAHAQKPAAPPVMEQGAMKDPFDTIAFTMGSSRSVYVRHR